MRSIAVLPMNNISPDTKGGLLEEDTELLTDVISSHKDIVPRSQVVRNLCVADSVCGKRG